MEGSGGKRVGFYAISSGYYFPGFVGMVNSLRLAGHREPVTVLERGMTRKQKTFVGQHCEVVSIDRHVANPCHLTAFPSQLNAEGVVILIDSDALVLGRLDQAIEGAAAGRICMFRDPDETRHFPEWEQIFGLKAPLRRQTYFNTGFVAFSVEAWPELLQRWWETLERIADRPSFMEGASLREDPTSQPDQDALNALLMSEVPQGAVLELPSHDNVFPRHFHKVTIRDLVSMDCTLDGRPVRMVQCSGSPKPWTWANVRYRRETHCFLPLLRRALAGDGLAMSVPPSLLPPWLQPGRKGELAYRALEKWFSVPEPRQMIRRLLGKVGLR